MHITPLHAGNKKEAEKIILSLGAAKEGARILGPKAVWKSFKIQGLKSWEANILKQHLLSLGSDAAIERDALIKNIKTDLWIFGSISQIKKLCAKLKGQTKGLRLISEKLRESLDNTCRQSYEFRARGKILRIKRPLICGVINLTRDSFSGDGLLGKTGLSSPALSDLALRKVSGMVGAGAKIIDIGAESTRPFSKRIRPGEELKRIVPVLKLIRKRFKKLVISVDTYKFKAAEAAAGEGADMINDITALADSKTAALVGKHKLGCVLMHMKGKPQNMQVDPDYGNPVEEIESFLRNRLEFCRKKGIQKQQILIDPGIGFGKLKKHNAEIINNLYRFKSLGRPLFIGLSRKSFIGGLTGKKVSGRLNGSVAAALVAAVKGADVLRVHDVAETKEAIDVLNGIQEKC